MAATARFIALVLLLAPVPLLAQNQGVCPIDACPSEALEGCVCDSNGKVINYLAREGLRPMRMTFTYDDAGNRLTKQWDRDDDGSIERRLSWTYDDEGRLVGWTDDLGADGSADEWMVWIYDELGNLGSEERGAGSRDGWLSRTTWQYDAEGNRVRAAAEFSDGSVERCDYQPPCPPPFSDDCECQ